MLLSASCADVASCHSHSISLWSSSPQGLRLKTHMHTHKQIQSRTPLPTAVTEVNCPLTVTHSHSSLEHIQPRSASSASLIVFLSAFLCPPLRDSQLFLSSNSDLLLIENANRKTSQNLCVHIYKLTVDVFLNQWPCHGISNGHNSICVIVSASQWERSLLLQLSVHLTGKNGGRWLKHAGKFNLNLGRRLCFNWTGTDRSNLTGLLKQWGFSLQCQWQIRACTVTA